MHKQKTKAKYSHTRFDIKYMNATPAYWIICNCTYNTHSGTTATAHGYNKKKKKKREIGRACAFHLLSFTPPTHYI